MRDRKIDTVKTEIELEGQPGEEFERMKEAGRLLSLLNIRVREVGAARHVLGKLKREVLLMTSIVGLAGAAAGAGAMAGDVVAAALAGMSALSMAAAIYFLLTRVMRASISVGITGSMFALIRHGYVEEKDVDAMKVKQLEVLL